MVQNRRVMKHFEKRQALAIAISVLVHAALLGGLALRAIPRPAQADRMIVDLSLVERPRSARPLIGAPPPTLIPESRRAPTQAALPSRREAQRPSVRPVPSAAGQDGALLSNAEVGTVSAGDAPSKASGANGVSDTPVLPSIPAPGALSFSDVERLTENGDRAREEAERYRQQQVNGRRNRGAFVVDSARVRTAMENRRSATIGARVLPLGKDKPDARAYLLKIHQKLEPLFSKFLTALDSPSEQLHKIIQKSFLKYNPFYVPPPDAVRQDTLRGPLSDLTMKTKTEFEILPTGALAEIRMLRSSNSRAFDAAALDTVIKGSPFMPPPAALISLNDRTYIQWTFCRDWKQNTLSKGRLLIIASLFGDGDTDGAAAEETSVPDTAVP